ncbi:MAG: hypothetical protein ACRD9R_23480, partial [Pyrinomonadaceae bacterium]
MTSRTRNSVAFAFLFLASFIAFWLWWNRPRKVDMAEYAPADALIFLEANDLPDIVAGLASTTAWQELAPAAGLRADTGSYLKLSRLAAWTGIGPSELVLFARAQAAAVVFGFDAAEEPGSSLRIRPQAAFIFETHSREGRAIAATEKLVGDLARRIFAAPRFGKRQDVAGAHIFTWGSADGSRQIVAAVMEGVVILGNEEAAVQRCLAVKRGEQASLAEDQQLVTMRERVVRAGALSFGYVSPAGARKLLEVAALAYAGQLSTNPSAQSAFAVLLPQLAERLLGSAAWSSRLVDGAVEDRYFLTGRGGLPERLRSPLVPFRETLTGAPNLLPAGLYQLTSYNFREPDAAWRALNQALSTQLDITLAPAGVRYLDEWLRPFGIESPREFFQTVGPGLYTARLDPAGEGLVFTAPVRDEAALRAQLLAVLGRRPRAERIGVHEMLFSGAEDGMAAGFVSGHVIMGAAEDVRQCLRQV